MKLIRIIKAKNSEIDLNNLIKSEHKTLEYIESLLKNNKSIPKILFEPFLEDDYWAEKLVELLLKFKQKIPNKLILTISSDSDLSAQIVDDFLKYTKDVPKILLDSATKKYYNAYQAAASLIEYEKEVPEYLIKSVSKDSHYSMFLATLFAKHNKEVPEILLKSIAKKKDVIQEYKNRLTKLGKPIPEIFKGRNDTKKYFDLRNKAWDVINEYIDDNYGPYSNSNSYEELLEDAKNCKKYLINEKDLIIQDLIKNKVISKNYDQETEKAIEEIIKEVSQNWYEYVKENKSYYKEYFGDY